MNFLYKRNDILKGLLVYGIGDSIAAIILGEFQLSRLLGIVLIGATVYAFEIPNYFNWIESKTSSLSGFKKSFYKTMLALLYFNPLWIFRHLIFIKLFSNDLNFSFKNILIISLYSFLVNIPISIFGNFIIQNKIKLNQRFLASAIFSALMAIYYALSETLFS
ncbi:MAG: hypothetical protein OEW87_05130 [Flavobacteriaceae bacterium]|nr:hypothetical protein [Flavobacteriaceae bacterium]